MDSGEMVHAIIRQRSSEGEVTDTLKMSQEEYEEIITKFSTSHRFLKYTSSVEDAKAAVPPGNTFINVGCVDNDGFVKALYLMNTLTTQVLMLMKEHKSFRFVVSYDVEALKTDFYAYAPDESTK